jgi:hypothetical protein
MNIANGSIVMDSDECPGRGNAFILVPVVCDDDVGWLSGNAPRVAETNSPFERAPMPVLTSTRINSATAMDNIVGGYRSANIDRAEFFVMIRELREIAAELDDPKPVLDEIDDVVRELAGGVNLGCNVSTGRFYNRYLDLRNIVTTSLG